MTYNLNNIFNRVFLKSFQLGSDFFMQEINYRPYFYHFGFYHFGCNYWRVRSSWAKYHENGVKTPLFKISSPSTL